MKKINNIKQILFILLAFAFVGINQAWGYSSTKLIVNISGSGQVAVTTSASAPSSYSASSVSADQGPHGFWDTKVTDSYYVWVKPNTGYYCSGVSSCTWNSSGYYFISFEGTTFTATKEVTATFVGNSYSISFDANGGSGSMNKLPMTYGAAKNLTNNAFSKTGYSFAGWNTKANGTGTSYANQQNVNNLTSAADAEVVLYAQWTPNTYYVAFNGNGSTSGTMSNQAFTYNAAATALTTNAYGRAVTVQFDANGGTCDSEPLVANATFLGWATTADGDVVYANEAPISNLTTTANGVVNVFAKWRNGTVILPTATAAQENYHLEGWYLNDERVGEAGSVYTATDNVTLVAQWTMESFDPVFTGQNTSLSVGEEQDNAFVFEHTDGPIAHIDVADIDPINDGSGKVIEFDATTNRVIARNAGTATIYFTQDAVGAINEGISETYTYTVTKNTPVFSLNKADIELGATAILSLAKVDNPTITIAPEGSLNYNAETGELTGLVAGTSTITVTQEETYFASAKEENFELNVLKKTPSLSVLLNGLSGTSLTLEYNQTATCTTEQISDGAVEIRQVDGEAYVTYADGVLKTLFGIGTAHFKVVLPETDTYYGKMIDFSIKVNAASGYLPYSNSTGYTMGNPAWTTGFNYANDSKILEFQGIPDKLSFSYHYYSDNITKGDDADYMMYVEESANKQTWSKIWDNSQPSTSEQSSGELQLQKTTRYIRFSYSANYGAYYTNIRVTDLKYVDDPEPASIDLGKQAINSGEVSATTLINWCNTAPLKVTCSNPRFTVTPESFGNYLQYSSQQLTIKYTHTNEVGLNEGDITVTNGLYTKTIHVSAETTKRPQTIIWNDQLVATGYAMNIGETYPDESIPYVAATANGELVTFASDNTDVIEIVDDTIIVAKSIGTANITATQAGDEEYQEATSTKQFTVTNLLKQSINWEQNLLMLLTTSGELELTATATSGGEVTYVSADESVVRVEGNMLIVVGEGETYVTASQAGGEIGDNEYIPATINNNVIVRNPASQCNGRALSVGSLTLNSSKLNQEYAMTGTPQVLTFSAKHGTKSGSFIGFSPVYSELIVEQYAFINNLWDWYKVYEKVVGTDATASGNITLDESAKKIRFRTTETGTDHTISSINVTRKKFLRSDVVAIDLEVESNAIWSKTITISHSNIDLMTVTAKQGLLTVPTTLGGGCGSFGDDQFTITFTPMQKYVHYYDTIVITDGKAQPSTITIPVHLYSKGLNQGIEGFVVPETAKTTDEIAPFHATATSLLPITYGTSDTTIARIVNDSVLEIVTAGTVEIYAIQAGNEKYDSTAVAKTLVISKVASTIQTLPQVDEIAYGQALAEATLTGGAASVEGTFAWQDPTIIPEAGEHAYTIVFTPANDAWYESATEQLTVTVAAAAAELTLAPVAFDTLVYTGEPQVLIEAGEAANGTLLYSLGDQEHFADMLPVATEAGEYTIYYYVAGDENYSSTDIASIVATITSTDTPSELLPQEIEWDVEYLSDTMMVGGPTENWLYASATSELPVYFTSSDSTIATIYDADGFLFLYNLKPGIVTITAHQDGNDVYAPAEPIARTFVITDENGEIPTTPTAIDPARMQIEVIKIIRDNQVLIIRDNRTYTASGLLVE